jgi:penicillin-binding protein 1A
MVLDDQGNELARFQLDKREPILFKDIPDHLIKAFLAAEDHAFFEHAGISWRGIVRSTLVNLYHGRKVQGASTITQQLVRLLFFDAQKTFTRKIKEQVYAVLVEMQFTKEHILETYLNHVCFGCGIYGVQAACQRFWGKHVADITLDEAAVLAGIVRSPNNYCPLTCPLSAQRRRTIVLRSMYQLGFITQDEYEHARNVPVLVKKSDKDLCAPYIKEMVRVLVEERVGKTMLYTGGLTIQTTINRAVQEQAQKAFNEQFHLLRSGQLPGVNGALVTIDVATGEIKALIGGVDFATSQFNRATQARRQMGSTFKPLVYTAGVENGISFADTEIDEPFEMQQNNGTVWRPDNFNDTFYGRMTLAYALSCSNNIVAIKTFLKVGAQKVVDVAQRCHIKGPLPFYPSLALGCVDVTLLDVVGMFNIFANDGVYVEPHLLRWIKDSWGTKIWKVTVTPERAISSRVCGQVAKVLELSLQRVQRAFPQPWIDGQAISKTGTTNDSRTCWFTASTPELTTAIYVGRDDNSSMGKDVFPLKTAFPIWLALHRALPLQRKKFTYDPSLREVMINKRTGRVTRDAHNPDAIAIVV